MLRMLHRTPSKKNQNKNNLNCYDPRWAEFFVGTGNGKYPFPGQESAGKVTLDEKISFYPGFIAYARNNIIPEASDSPKISE